MALYHIEGTSLIGWSRLVRGGSDSKASEPALRIVRCLSDLRQDHVRDARQQVVGSSQDGRDPGSGSTQSLVGCPERD
jgi:hypothetical protein